MEGFARMIFVLAVLAAPIVAAALFWGSWAWTAASIIVAVVEFAAFRRSQRFSARMWRSIPVGHRHRRERATETTYVVAALAGVVLLAVAIAHRA